MQYSRCNPTNRRLATMFSQTDFDNNPSKYQLFKTAVIAKPIGSGSTRDWFHVGRCVSIQYHSTRENYMFPGAPKMPIYLVDNDIHLFAAALDNFVL